MNIYSIYSGYVNASTGVAAVLLALDEGDWTNFKLNHNIFSLDNKGKKILVKENQSKLLHPGKISLLSKFKKSCFKQLSSLRQKLWKMSENSNLLAVSYIYLFHKLRAYKHIKEFITHKGLSHRVVVHDVWSLLALNASGYDLKQVVFVIHGSDDPMSFILKIFPKLKDGKFINQLSNDFESCIQKLKSVVVLSDENQKNISQRYKVKSTLILNGIRQEPYRKANESSLVLHITGSVCARKRQYLLVEAINKIGNDFLINNNVTVNLFGGGPDYRLLSEMVDNYGLSLRVKLHGDTDMPFKQYKLGDLILCISTEEGLPIALIEGIRAGCIPIVTDVGGCNLVTSNNNGFVLSGMSDDSVRIELESLFVSLTDNVDRESLGKKSIALFSQEFSNQKMVEEYAKEILA